MPTEPYRAPAALLAVATLVLQGCGLSAIIGTTVAVTRDDSSSTRTVPAPTVSAVSPSSASHKGGITVTITGTSFPTDAASKPTVTFGGVSATNVVVGSDTSLTCTLPRRNTPIAGPADVSVTNPVGGTGTLAGGFTYTNAPPVAAIAAVPTPQSQNVVFSVTLTDDESDAVEILVSVASGTGSFAPIPANLILSGSTLGLTSSPAGVTHNLTWDSRGTFPAQNATNVRLQVAPSDTGLDTVTVPAPVAVTSNAFDVRNNTPVQVEVVQPSDDAFDVVLAFRVTDPDTGDPVTVTALTFRDLKTGATGDLSVKSGQGLGSVLFSAGGTQSSTVWASLANLGLGNNKLVDVTVTVSDGTNTASATTAPFFVSNGPVADQAVFDFLLDSEGLAVGDVVSSKRRVLGAAVGTFLVGETVQELPAGPTATVVAVGTGFIELNQESGTFTAGSTLQGLTSGATIVFNGLAPFPLLPDLVACTTGITVGQTAADRGQVAVLKNRGLDFEAAVVTTVIQDLTTVHTVEALAFAPAFVYAGTNGGGVFRSADGGVTWTPRNTGLLHRSVFDLAVHPLVPAEVYAATMGGGVYRSIDNGDNWVQVGSAATGLTFPIPPFPPTTPTGLALDVTSLVVVPSIPAVVYAGTFGGVFVSLNGGVTWGLTNLNLATPGFAAVQDLVLDASTLPVVTLYAGTQGRTGVAGGVFRTGDGGATWAQVNGPGPDITVRDVRALAIDPTTGGAAARVYAGTFGGGVFRTDDSGLSWIAINTGLPASPPFPRLVVSLALDAATPETLYAGLFGIGPFGAVFKSTNAATGAPPTWAQAVAGFPAPAGPNPAYNVNALAVQPGTTEPAAVVLAGTQSINGVPQPGLVLRSTDSAATWAVSNTGITGLNTRNNTNFFLSTFSHVSEACVADVNSDGLGDLLAASSAHGPNTGQELVRNATSVLLLQALADYQNAFGNVANHQRTLRALQRGDGLDLAGATFESTQAALQTGRAPNFPFTAPPAASTDPSINNVGWFVQDVVAAPLTSPAATQSVRRDDVVILHGIRQLGSALGGAPGGTNGSVAVRQVIPATGQVGPAFYLDGTNMGVIPTHCAVADITSAAHAGAAGFPLQPGTPVPAGTPDVVVACTGDSSLTFFLQLHPAFDAAVDPFSGQGPNQPAPTFFSIRIPLAPAPPAGFGLPPGDLRGVALGDLNGDGANDLLVVGQLSKRAFVFVYDPATTDPTSLNTATGGLIPLRLAGVFTLPEIQVGRPGIRDFTGDGRADILIPMVLTNELLVYANLGNAPAAPPTTTTPTPLFGPAPPDGVAVRFTTEFQPSDLAIVDLNGDRRDDVAVMSNLSQDASVFYQTTQGTLDRFLPVPSGTTPFLMDAGDVTGDGVADIACSMNGENRVHVYSRSGGTLVRVGNFDLNVQGAVPNQVRPSLPFDLRIADGDGDGARDDVLVAMEVVLQGTSVNAGNNPQPISSTAGFELIQGGPLAASVALVRTGTFAPIGFSADAGDFLFPGGVPDGIPDVVLGHNQSQGTAQGLALYRGLGGGAFDPNPTGVVTVSLTQVQVVDLDGDGLRDVVAGTGSGNNGVKVFYNGGGVASGPVPPGTFPPVPDTIDTSGAGLSLGCFAADLGGPLNGGLPMLDVVLTGFTSAEAGILYQTAPRVFQPVALTVGGEPAQGDVGDLNGDGRNDLVMAWGKENLIAVYYQNPAPTGLADTLFGPVTFPTANSPIGVAILDVDADGRNDVVVSARGADSLNVFLQR